MELQDMGRRQFHNAPPQGVAADAPADHVKVEFGKRLQSLIADHGLTQVELARRAAKFMPNRKFGRDNITNYVRGVCLPNPAHLAAMAKAFGVEPREMLPARGIPSVSDNVTPLEARELDNGRVWLKVNQETSWDIAVQVMALLRGKPPAAGGE